MFQVCDMTNRYFARASFNSARAAEAMCATLNAESGYRRFAVMKAA